MTTQTTNIEFYQATDTDPEDDIETPTWVLNNVPFASDVAETKMIRILELLLLTAPIELRSGQVDDSWDVFTSESDPAYLGTMYVIEPPA